MFVRSLTVADGLRAAGFLLGGVLLGALVYQFARIRLRRVSTLTELHGQEIVQHAVRDAAILLLTLGGAYAAVASLPFRPRVADGIGRAIVALTIAAATLIAMRISGAMIKLYALRTPGAVRSSSIFVNLARLSILAVGLLVMLGTLGISITPLLTALGVGGLAAALALQDTLSNLFAGVHVIASRKVQPGDYVKLDTGEEGFVTDINWRNTTVRQLADNIIIVPNARMASAVVTNYEKPMSQTAILVGVSAAYGADLAHVERVTCEVAHAVLREVPGGVAEFEPFVRFHTFNDSSIDFNVILRVQTYTDQFLVKHEFMKRLAARYAEEGIDFPFPTRTVHLHDASRDGA